MTKITLIYFLTFVYVWNLKCYIQSREWLWYCHHLRSYLNFSVMPVKTIFQFKKGQKSVPDKSTPCVYASSIRLNSRKGLYITYIAVCFLWKSKNLKYLKIALSHCGPVPEIPQSPLQTNRGASIDGRTNWRIPILLKLHLPT